MSEKLSSLPPYFNIDPDAALAALGTPTGTHGFESIAHACEQGRRDLASRGLEENGERRLRLDPERVAAYPSVRFEQDEHLVEATVFPVDGIRQAPVSPVDGRPMRRADVHELEQLISAS